MKFDKKITKILYKGILFCEDRDVCQDLYLTYRTDGLFLIGKELKKCGSIRLIRNGLILLDVRLEDLTSMNNLIYQDDKMRMIKHRKKKKGLISFVCYIPFDYFNFGEEQKIVLYLYNFLGIVDYYFVQIKK